MLLVTGCQTKDCMGIMMHELDGKELCCDCYKRAMEKK